MEALAAVCDTFVPSVDITTRGNQLAAAGPLGSCGENGDHVDDYAGVEHLAKVSHDQIDAFTDCRRRMLEFHLRHVT